MNSVGLHEKRKVALGNYLEPETAPSRFHRRVACLSPVGLTRWNSLGLGTDSRNHRTDTTEVMIIHHPDRLVSGIDLIRSSFRTCSHPCCLVTPDYTWGCCYTHTCDWIEQLIASLYLIFPDEIKQWCVNPKGSGIARRGKASTNMKAST